MGTRGARAARGARDRGRGRGADVTATPFSVVVVIHDSATELAVLLESVRRHLPEPPQVVVVDAGSHDGGAALAREHGAEVIERPDNPGFGPASNTGLVR